MNTGVRIFETEPCRREPGGMFRCLYDREWTLTNVSNGVYQLLEYNREEVWEHFHNKFLGLVDPRDRGKIAQSFREQAECGKEIGAEIRLQCRSGYKWVWISGSLWMEDRAQFICMVYDQTSQREALQAVEMHKREAARAWRAAARDSLTQTYNRAATESMVRSYIEDGRGMAAFLVADIDNFKEVNDTLGHIYGDTLLSQVAMELKKLINENGFVGRLGGDEFVLFMEDLKGEQEAVELAGKAGEIFAKALCGRLAWPEVTGSLGISFYPKDGTTFRELLTKADDAMYYAKNHGKNRCAVYDLKVEKERKLLPSRERGSQSGTEPKSRERQLEEELERYRRRFGPLDEECP